MTAKLEARFLTGARGRRFALLHTPAAGPCAAAVVYVPPFADEMNKARRVAALASRALAGRGLAVLQLDLGGCGDSEGEFVDATWEGWIDDVAAASDWLAAHVGCPPWLWGLRAGALLALAAAAARSVPASLLLWQPVASGRQQLAQFLRTRTVAEALAGDGEGGARAVRAALAAGEVQHVAGYALGSALARGLEHAEPAAPPTASRVLWLETGAAEPRAPSPVAQRVTEHWRAGGCTVNLEFVPGPAFWQTVEIAESPLLVERTAALLAGEDS